MVMMFNAVDQPSEFVPLETDARMFPAGNGSLLIRAADPVHEGHYSCEASNGIGANLRKLIFLRVNGRSKRTFYITVRYSTKGIA